MGLNIYFALFVFINWTNIIISWFNLNRTSPSHVQLHQHAASHLVASRGLPFGNFNFPPTEAALVDLVFWHHMSMCPEILSRVKAMLSINPVVFNKHYFDILPIHYPKDPPLPLSVFAMRCSPYWNVLILASLVFIQALSSVMNFICLEFFVAFVCEFDLYPTATLSMLISTYSESSRHP